MSRRTKPHSRKLGGAAIAGIVAAIIVIIALIIGLYRWWRDEPPFGPTTIRVRVPSWISNRRVRGTGGADTGAGEGDVGP